jgi:hypothetical protein
LRLAGDQGYCALQVLQAEFVRAILLWLHLVCVGLDALNELSCLVDSVSAASRNDFEHVLEELDKDEVELLFESLID